MNNIPPRLGFFGIPPPSMFLTPPAIPPPAIPDAEAVADQILRGLIRDGVAAGLSENFQELKSILQKNHEEVMGEVRQNHDKVMGEVKKNHEEVMGEVKKVKELYESFSKSQDRDYYEEEIKVQDSYYMDDSVAGDEDENEEEEPVLTAKDKNPPKLEDIEKHFGVTFNYGAGSKKQVNTRRRKGTDSFLKLDQAQARVATTLVNAYKKAASSVEEDWKCAADLEKAGVVLPEGWRPVSPLHMEEGEFMVEQFH